MKQRIDFIDLAKGFGIIFIISYHIRILPQLLIDVTGACVPLFFIMSGMFFTPPYEDFKSFALKKINTILVPFIFFYCTPYIFFYLFEAFIPGLIKTHATGILDVFTQYAYFNGPIWFLLSLFWDFIIIWWIFNLIKPEILRLLIIVMIAFCGVCLSYYNMFVPMNIDSAFTCLPFLYVGSVFRVGILKSAGNKLIILLCASALLVLAVWLNLIFTPVHVNLYNNTIVGNVFVNYLIVIFSSLGIILFCKIINYIPFINYFGKYSLIPLCLHHMIYRPILIVCEKLPCPLNCRVFVTIFTILIIWGLIPLCIRYIPWVVGKKPIFKVNS